MFVVLRLAASGTQQEVWIRPRTVAVVVLLLGFALDGAHCHPVRAHVAGRDVPLQALVLVATSPRMNILCTLADRSRGYRGYQSQHHMPFEVKSLHHCIRVDVKALQADTTLTLAANAPWQSFSRLRDDVRHQTTCVVWQLLLRLHEAVCMCTNTSAVTWQLLCTDP